MNPPVELRWIRPGHVWTLQYRCNIVKDATNPTITAEWSPWITVPFMAPDTE